MKIQKSARVGYEVHVKAKLHELYDFDQFTQLQRQVIDDLGCTACTSGANLRFDIERFFGKYNEAELATLSHREIASEAIDVRVIASREVINNFDSNVAARRAVLKELGCLACTSGYNILFEHEFAFAVDQKGVVVNLG